MEMIITVKSKGLQLLRGTHTHTHTHRKQLVLSFINSPKSSWLGCVSKHINKHVLITYKLICLYAIYIYIYIYIYMIKNMLLCKFINL